MYAVGDLITQAGTGVCRILEIGEPGFLSAKEHRLYYTMVSLEDSKTRLYIPVEPEPAGVRKAMTKDQALALLQQFPAIVPVCIGIEKQREQQYRQALRSNDPLQIAAVIKTLYARIIARTTHGKKVTATDKHYFQQAENLLYSEIALAIGVPEQEVPAMIRAAFPEETEK